MPSTATRGFDIERDLLIQGLDGMGHDTRRRLTRDGEAKSHN